VEGARWANWLRDVTGEDTVRGIARKVGRSHTQVQRWIAKGVPPDTVWEITLRFKADPVSALIALGRVTPEQVPQLNWAEIVRYAPAEVLTAELHNRTVTALRARPEVDPKKQATPV
jgi:hypothetical protein